MLRKLMMNGQKGLKKDLELLFTIRTPSNECAQLKQQLDDMEKTQVPLEEVSAETNDDQKEQKPGVEASKDILEKNLKELDETKGLKEEIKHLQHHNLTAPKNKVEVFSDSFFQICRPEEMFRQRY